MARIQVVIDEVEREEFRAMARREGKSLSEWLRDAGRRRLAETSGRGLDTRAALAAFFDEIDRAHAGQPAEEDWQVHKARIESGHRPRLVP